MFVWLESLVIVRQQARLALMPGTAKTSELFPARFSYRTKETPALALTAGGRFNGQRAFEK
jgi:hypothetical protein